MRAPGILGDPFGIPIVESAAVPDGVLLAIPGQKIVIGTGPIDNSEWCRREALRIVQTGLAEVLEWLGEPPWRPPATSAGILARLRTWGGR